MRKEEDTLSFSHSTSELGRTCKDGRPCWTEMLTSHCPAKKAREQRFSSVHWVQRSGEGWCEDQVDSVRHERESNLQIGTRTADGRHVKQGLTAVECGFRLANRKDSWHLEKMRRRESKRWDAQMGIEDELKEISLGKGRNPKEILCDMAAI